ALEWKTRWPVSTRLVFDRVIVPLLPMASMAGSRDWTTTAPLPSNATAIGCPTVGGTSGSGTPQVFGGTAPPPVAPPDPVILAAGSSEAASGTPPMKPPGLQGP